MVDAKAKIKIIKEVRALTGLGLKEVREFNYKNKLFDFMLLVLLYCLLYFNDILLDTQFSLCPNRLKTWWKQLLVSLKRALKRKSWRP